MEKLYKDFMDEISPDELPCACRTTTVRVVRF